MLGGKEEIKRRKTGDNPCELPSKDFCGYVIDKFQCTCGRKEGKRTLVDCILQILTSVYTLVLTWPFPSPPPKALCLNLRVSCCVVNCFPCMSYFCGEGTSSAMFFLCC